MGKLSNEERLWIYSMGKRFRVTAIFTDDDVANAYMARNNGQGVIAVCQGVVFLADLHDSGTSAERVNSDLADALLTALPYVESAETDPGYKPGAVARVTRKIRAALTAAGAV